MAQDLVSRGKNVASPDVYSDLDLLFIAHPITGDVSRKLDTDAIKRAVKNIVLTNYYERPFKPSLAGGVRNLLFELDTDARLSRAKKQLTKTLQLLEPRITRVRCDFFKSGANGMTIIINYTIKNGMPNQEVEFTVRRTR
jgi:phage baseplate assembly protein W